MSLKLKKFDLSKIKPHATMMYLAKKNSGKSELIKRVLYAMREIPVGCVISPTERANKFYSNFIPNIFIHDDYSPNYYKIL